MKWIIPLLAAVGLAGCGEHIVSNKVSADQFWLCELNDNDKCDSNPYRGLNKTCRTVNRSIADWRKLDDGGLIVTCGEPIK